MTLVYRAAHKHRYRLSRSRHQGESSELSLWEGGRGGQPDAVGRIQHHDRPEAARVVSNRGAHHHGRLDVTHRLSSTPGIGGSSREWAGRRFAAEDFYSQSLVKGLRNPVPTPRSAAVFDEGVITTRHVRVDIETRGEFTAGRTVVDFGGVTGRPPNARVAVGVDRDRFIAHIMNAIAALDAGVWRDARPDRM